MDRFMRMRRYLLISLLAMAPAAHAADGPVSGYTAASALSGTELIYCVQSGSTRKCTAAQVATYIFGLVSGDLTCSGATCTVTKINGTTPGTGVVTALGVNVGSAGSMLVNGGVLGTPSSGTATNITGYTVAHLSGAGTGVLTALGVNIGSAGAPVLFNGALGTPSSATLTSATGLPIAGITGLGSNVGTALAVALSAAGGLTKTVANGTAALGTSAIASGVCGTATTVAATGVATTDTINAGFSGDPTAVTGYTATGMLTIIPYPTSGNVNFKQCNLTAISITPSALTINWWVQR